MGSVVKFDLKRVLFVEDEPQIFDLIKLSLTKVGGLDGHGFRNGYDAIAQAPRLRAQLVLLDLMMPGLDGETVFQKLRDIEGYETVPIVFLTAKVNLVDFQRLKALGAAAVFPKPFDPFELADALQGIWFSHIEQRFAGHGKALRAPGADSRLLH